MKNVGKVYEKVTTAKTKKKISLLKKSIVKMYDLPFQLVES